MAFPTRRGGYGADLQPTHATRYYAQNFGPQSLNQGSVHTGRTRTSDAIFELSAMQRRANQMSRTQHQAAAAPIVGNPFAPGQPQR